MKLVLSLHATCQSCAASGAGCPKHGGEVCAEGAVRHPRGFIVGGGVVRGHGLFCAGPQDVVIWLEPGTHQATNSFSGTKNLLHRTHEGRVTLTRWYKKRKLQQISVKL